MEKNFKLSELIVFTKKKSGHVEEYLAGIDLQKIRCIKVRSMLAEEAHNIIKYLQKTKIVENLTNLSMISIGRNCQFKKKVAKDLCKLILAIPSMHTLVFHGWFDKKENEAELYKGLQKIPFLKRISIEEGSELRKKEDLKFIQTTTAELDLIHRKGGFASAIQPLSEILKKSSTIRSLELLIDPISTNFHLFPALAINTSITRLSLTLDAPGYDFSALKPLALPNTQNNLEDLEIDGRHYINGDSMDVIFDILNNNTKLKKLSLRRINDIQTQLGRSLAKNSTLQSLTLADLEITPELLEGFKMNTTLVDLSVLSNTYLSICQSVTENPNRNLKSLAFGLGILYQAKLNLQNESSLSLCQMLKSINLTKLELNDVADLDVAGLVEGLNSATNHITNLKIRSKALKRHMIEPLMLGIEQNRKIQLLDLSYNTIVGDEYRPIWNMLVKNKTLRRLIIADMSREAGVNDESLMDLMQVLKINTTLLYLEIWPRDYDKAAELFLDLCNSASTSLWHFYPMSQDNYQIDLILRNNIKRYLDIVVLYYNIKKYNATILPLELWAQIFSNLIHV